MSSRQVTWEQRRGRNIVILRYINSPPATDCPPIGPAAGSRCRYPGRQRNQEPNARPGRLLLTRRSCWRARVCMLFVPDASCLPACLPALYVAHIPPAADLSGRDKGERTGSLSAARAAAARCRCASETARASQCLALADRHCPRPDWSSVQLWPGRPPQSSPVALARPAERLPVAVGRLPLAPELAMPSSSPRRRARG